MSGLADGARGSRRRRLLRSRRGGQDHGLGHAGPGRWPSRAERVVVLTVDPARRLAEALGIEQPGADPVPGARHRARHRSHALMLDAEGTFDALIERYATSAEQAGVDQVEPPLSVPGRRPQRHPGVHGHGEALRALRVGRLRRRRRRHPADAQRARPARRAPAADRRSSRTGSSVPCSPRPGSTCGPSRWPRGPCSSTIGSVAGAELVDDAVTFFQAFAGMEEGFAAASRRRPRAAPSPGHGLRARHLAAPRRHRRGALLRRSRSAEAGMRTAGVIVNRVQPRFGAERCPSRRGARRGATLGALVANLERARAGRRGRAGGPRRARSRPWRRHPSPPSR